MSGFNFDITKVPEWLLGLNPFDLCRMDFDNMSPKQLEEFATFALKVTEKVGDPESPVQFCEPCDEQPVPPRLLEQALVEKHIPSKGLGLGPIYGVKGLNKPRELYNLRNNFGIK